LHISKLNQLEGNMKPLALSIARLIALPMVAFLASCGGGGGSSTGVSASTSYTAVAMAGELLTYTIDTTNLTYSYTITDSQYGLTGTTGSGTLVHNIDGTYSPSGISNAKLAILPNGLILGAIRVTLNGTPTSIPIIGMTHLVTEINSGAATYNFVQRSCLSGICGAAYGTFQISSTGTWTFCPSGNLTTGCSGSTNSGTLNSLGNGKWQVMNGATDIGTAIMLNSSGQRIVMLDLKDTRMGGFGVGLLVGSSQQSMNVAMTNGTWVTASTTGNWGIFSASGNQFSYITVNGMASNVMTTFSADSPWTGVYTAASGGHGVLAGNGIYIFENTGGYVEIGVKIN
jgi:hypothetical protein